MTNNDLKMEIENKVLPGTGGAFRGRGGSSLCVSKDVRISIRSFSKSSNAMKCEQWISLWQTY